MGALLTGFFATPEANSNLNTNLAAFVGKTLWIEQLKAIGLTMTLAIVGTAALAMLVKVTIGLRPDREAEEGGLDQADHGEAGYHDQETMGYFWIVSSGFPPCFIAEKPGGRCTKVVTAAATIVCCDPELP